MPSVLTTICVQVRQAKDKRLAKDSKDWTETAPAEERVATAEAGSW